MKKIRTKFKKIVIGFIVFIYSLANKNFAAIQQMYGVVPIKDRVTNTTKSSVSTGFLNIISTLELLIIPPIFILGAILYFQKSKSSKKKKIIIIALAAIIIFLIYLVVDYFIFH